MSDSLAPLTLEETLAALTRANDEMPRAAFAAAETHRAAITPALIASIEALTIATANNTIDPEDQLPIYAMYLGAVWREKKIHAPLLAFLSLPGDLALNATEDILTEQGDKLLAQTCGGDWSGVTRLAENSEVDLFVRCAALRALGLLMHWGEMPRAVLLTRYLTLISTYPRLPDKETSSHILGEIANLTIDFGLVELREPLLALFDQDLIDEFIAGRSEVEELGTTPYIPDEFLPITDVADAISWWACFSPKWDENLEEDDLMDEVLDEPRPIPPAVPYSYEPQVPYRAPVEVGRNDPCPCGTGKKFKKCCGAALPFVP